jgi:CMP-N,N'-diacetyllegionaminic acid synthase
MIVALIPARCGSKGVPGKNIRPLGGHPLLAYSIAAAQLSSSIDRVIVSTDSAQISDIARRYGAEAPFLRPAALSADDSPDRGFVLHALDWFAAHGERPDYLVHLRPTTPLRDPALIDDAVSRLRDSPDATSLRSAHEAPESPLKWFTLDGSEFFTRFGQDRGGEDYSVAPRQLVPAAYIPDGYVDVLRTNYVLEAADIHGPRILAYVSPRCVEIDTIEEFDYVDYVMRRIGGPLLDHLNTHYPAGNNAVEQ